MTTALGAASAIVLTRALVGESEVVAWAAFFLAMVLVAAATVVGTMWSGPNLVWGSVVGLVLAAPPVSIVTWVGVIAEGDPFGPIVSVFVTVAAVALSGASWAAAFGVALWLKNGRAHRAAMPLAG